MTNLTRITCPECNGKRTYTVTIDHHRKYGGVEYRDTKQPTVERLHGCIRCHGAGTIRVACVACHDTGEIAVADIGGHYDGMEPCTCAAGRTVMAATPATAYVAGSPF